MEMGFRHVESGPWAIELSRVGAGTGGGMILRYPPSTACPNKGVARSKGAPDAQPRSFPRANKRQSPRTIRQLRKITEIDADPARLGRCAEAYHSVRSRFGHLYIGPEAISTGTVHASADYYFVTPTLPLRPRGGRALAGYAELLEDMFFLREGGSMHLFEDLTSSADRVGGGISVLPGRLCNKYRAR